MTLMLIDGRWSPEQSVPRGALSYITIYLFSDIDIARTWQYCAIWHQDVSSRFCKSCKLRGGDSMDGTCLSSTSHRCGIGMRYGEFRGQANTLNSQQDNAWQGALSCWCIHISSCVLLLKSQQWAVLTSKMYDPTNALCSHWGARRKQTKDLALIVRGGWL